MTYTQKLINWQPKWWNMWLACRVVEHESISVNMCRTVSGSLMTKLLSSSNWPPTSYTPNSIITLTITSLMMMLIMPTTSL